jgi:predicted DNA binding CopG/RHH family protein
MKHNLTEEEKAIEKHADKLRPVSAGRREEIESIIRKARKNQAISLRLSEFDLEMLKKKAESEGLPYQTLISSVLHKYVTDQLFDRNEVRKAITELAVNQTP